MQERTEGDLGRKRGLPLRGFRTSGRRRHAASQIIIDRLQAQEVVEGDHHNDNDHHNPRKQKQIINMNSVMRQDPLGSMIISAQGSGSHKFNKDEQILHKTH